MSVQTDLEKLASNINKLKVQHDMFFIGSIPKLPLGLKKEVEDTLKKYRNSQRLNYAQRFHFNTLLSKYNALNELWTKMIRELELTGHSPIFKRKSGAAIGEPVGANGEKIIASKIISGTKKDLEKIRKLHLEYLAARKITGNGQNSLPFKRFITKLVRQANAIREKTKCQDIEIKIVIKDEKVLIKARGLQ